MSPSLKLLESRRSLPLPPPIDRSSDAAEGCAPGRSPYARSSAEKTAEGGCGVIGLASTAAIEGRHIFRSCSQMRNRGNGKGGGVCAVGLDAASWGVDAKLLKSHTLLQIAYVDPACREQVENEFVRPFFDIAQEKSIEHIADYHEIPGVDMRPPDVRIYFVRVRVSALDQFMREHKLAGAPREEAEGEFIYQNSYYLNRKFYADLGQKAFILSHGKDMAVFKIVAYAEDAVRYYRLDGMKAKIWIGHQRYPTKGRVWHPGGAHPFIGLHEALVHNGDFANYARVRKYLRQRNIHPLFLTDTEVAVLLFDLWTRSYRYPLEYAIEAMAPTTERDFFMLPPEKQNAYRAIQTASIKGSPDGPWFFIIARSDPKTGDGQLIGVTDTSMLRPQVFALQDRGGERIAFIASEKQSIDAALESLSEHGYPFAAPADRYWNARGGSYSDGGAFVFTVRQNGDVQSQTEGFPDKTSGRHDSTGASSNKDPSARGHAEASAGMTVTNKFGQEIAFSGVDFSVAKNDRKTREFAAKVNATAQARLDWSSRGKLEPPARPEDALAVDGSGFPVEGPEGLNIFLAYAHRLGWRRLVAHGLRGHRFLGCGFGAKSEGVLELYGSPGDYLGSGMDGLTLIVHNNAQDQAGQILKTGKLVVHGDVGQTFMYGAKGGEAYVQGNAAGRPLINAVGKPRVVINGTALDYLAESFMAGDPLKGGGFVILNAVRLVGEDRIEPLETPYPGGNLFSLASGGAIYVRDPKREVGEDQLNGGRLETLEPADWGLIFPYLEENERLFGIAVESLLTHEGHRLEPGQIYRKVAPTRLRALVLAHD